MTTPYRLAGAGAALVAVLVLTAPPASAHAVLTSSDPQDGARLARAPGELTLSFSEDPEPSLTSVEVLDPSGTTYQEGEPRVVPGSPGTVRVELGGLEQDTYTVTWRTVSRVDGHASAGAFTFGVGEEPSAVAAPQLESSPPPGTSPLEVTGRWLLLTGLVVVLGASWVALLLSQDGAGLRTLAALGVALSFVGLVALGESQRQASAVGFGELFDTSVGRALLWRAGALLAAAGAVVFVSRTSKAWWIAGAAAVAAMLAHVAAGHAAGAELPAVEVAAQWVHLVAVGIWLGGLASLLLAIRGAPGPEKARAVRRFSTVAGITLLTVAATGVFRAWDEIGRPGELLSSGYGRVVLIKGVLLVVLAALGAINRYRHVALVGRTLAGLRRIARLEVAVAVAALVAAALLASLAPPSGRPASAARASILVASGADFATTMRVRLEVDPGTAGLNRFTVTLADYDTREPLSARAVSLRFRFLDGADISESILELRRTRRGVYARDGGNLSLEGRWEVTVLVERGVDSVEVPLEVATPCSARRLAQQGQTTLYEIPVGRGGTLQAYAEPRRAGHNTVHLTFFAGDGGELRVPGRLRVEASQGDEERGLSVRRFGPGHFAADGQLDPGRWRFSVESARAAVRGCFEEVIRP